MLLCCSGSGSRIVCPYHPDANLIEDYHAGDMICPDCGLVVGDRYEIVAPILHVMADVYTRPTNVLDYIAPKGQVDKYSYSYSITLPK